MKLNKIIITIIFLILVANVYGFSEDFSVYSKNPTIYASQCEIILDKLSFYNTGDVNSIYTLEKLDYGWVTLTSDYFSLDAGEKGTVYNYINIPCDAKDGSYKLETKVTTGLGLSKTVTQTLFLQRINNIYLSTERNSFEVCPCSPVAYNLILKNVGKHAEVYHFSADELEGFVSINPKDIVLEPNGVASVVVSVNPTCDVYGNKTINLYVDAENSGLRSVLPLNLNILGCYNYDVLFGDYHAEGVSFNEHKGDYEICENEIRKIPVKITNNAPVTNNYNIRIEAPESVSIDYNRIENLAQNQELILFITLKGIVLKGIGEPQNFNIFFDINSELGDVEKSANIPVNFLNCYIPEIKENIANVNYSRTITRLEIENTGVFAAQYKINSTLPDWVKHVSNINIGAGSKAKLDIITEPSDDIKEGSYKGNIILTAQNGASYLIPVVVALKKVSLKEAILGYHMVFVLTLVSLLVLVVFFSVLIRYSSRIKKEKEEKKEAIEEAVVKKEQIKAEKKKEKVVEPEKAVRVVKPNIWVRYLIIFIALLVILIGFVLYQKFPITPLNVTNFTGENITLPTEENITVPAELVAGNLTLRDKLNSFYGRASDVIVRRFLLKSGYYLKVYSIKGYAYAKEFARDAFEYTQDFTLKSGYYAKRFFVDYWGYILIGVVVLAIILVLLRIINRARKKGRKAKEKIKLKKEKIEKETKVVEKKAAEKKIEWKKYIISFFVIVAIFLIVFAGIRFIPPLMYRNATEEALQEAKGIPNQMWKQDTSTRINLDNYFSDPDGDKLYYSATKAKNISIEIKDNIAILTPDRGWTGNTSVVFTADDRKGGVTRSNSVRLEVVKATKIGIFFSRINGFFKTSAYAVKDKIISGFSFLKDSVATYSSYIVAGFVILIIIVILIKFYKPILDFLEEEKR